jgi:hypothetical protein
MVGMEFLVADISEREEGLPERMSDDDSVRICSSPEGVSIPRLLRITPLLFGRRHGGFIK